MTSDESVLENDVIFLTETQLHPHTEGLGPHFSDKSDEFLYNHEVFEEVFSWPPHLPAP